MKQGWIKIHRKLLECDDIWDYDEPYTRRDAWIELLLLANHSDKSIIFDNHRIIVKRGQYLTSVRKLSARWQWGKHKTLNFLRLLEECEMIEKESDSRRTLITIVNYGIYQATENEEGTVKRQLGDSEGTVKGQSLATNKNDKECNKNEKNEKNNISPLPPLGEGVAHDFDKHTNLSNYEYLKNNLSGEFIDYICNHIELDNCLTKWMKHKDERKPKSSNHYSETGMTQLLNKAYTQCCEKGIVAIIRVIEDSLSNNYQGITWDKARSQQSRDVISEWRNS